MWVRDFVKYLQNEFLLQKLALLIFIYNIFSFALFFNLNRVRIYFPCKIYFSLLFFLYKFFIEIFHHLYMSQICCVPCCVKIRLFSNRICFSFFQFPTRMPLNHNSNDITNILKLRLCWKNVSFCIRVEHRRYIEVQHKTTWHHRRSIFIILWMFDFNFENVPRFRSWNFHDDLLSPPFCWFKESPVYFYRHYSRRA